jgi:hypothetical protein
MLDEIGMLPDLEIYAYHGKLLKNLPGIKKSGENFDYLPGFLLMFSI